MDFSKLEDSIGYKFNNIKLLKQALTHSSYAYEQKVESYEKLEFLGDSILEFVSSEFLYRNYDNLKEGEMTKVRASVVCEESLSKVSKMHNFSDFLLLGKSEILNNGSQRKAVLEDTFEAVVAAIYLDGGLEPAKKFIIDNLKDSIEISSKSVGMKDYKTVLQEMLQVNGNVNIKYTIIKEEGPDHDKKFTAKVECEGKYLAIGEGSSKKHAEMEAAKKAIEILKK